MEVLTFTSPNGKVFNAIYGLEGVGICPVCSQQVFVKVVESKKALGKLKPQWAKSSFNGNDERPDGDYRGYRLYLACPAYPRHIITFLYNNEAVRAFLDKQPVFMSKEQAVRYIVNEVTDNTKLLDSEDRNEAEVKLKEWVCQQDTLASS